MIKSAQRRSLGFKHLRPFALLWIAVLVIGARATFGQTYKVDAADSQALTTYLRQHRLPLVGAQVLADNAGNRRIVLYGFVATEFGKNDAAHKALTFIGNGTGAGTPMTQVENRIEIRPEIARMKTQTTPGPGSDNESLDQILNDIDRYGVTMAPFESAPK
jgi:hypothetical protein